jgi:hypothetical protein
MINFLPGHNFVSKKEGLDSIAKYNRMKRRVPAPGVLRKVLCGKKEVR